MSLFRLFTMTTGLVALVACGGQAPDASQDPGEPEAAVTESATPTPEPEATPEVADDGSLSLGNATITVIGESRGDEAGSSLAVVGDVNGDGFDDLLVGAWANDSTAMDAGKAYLILGRESGWGEVTDLSQADATFIGEAANDLVGFSLSGVGDVNADGFDDFAISAQGIDTQQRNGGCVSLFLGRAAADWGQDVPITEADAIFWGREEMDYTGFSLAALGDIDGDGVDDFGFSRQSNLGDSGQAGILEIVFGQTGTTPSESGAQITISQPSALFAYSMAGAGDVNGDGIDDLVIGAPQRHVADIREVGAAYLVLGRTRDQWPAESLIGSLTHASYLGDGERSLTGHSVIPAGDLNRDGFDDFAVSAPRNRERVDVGKWMGGGGQTYVILGSANPPSGEISLNSDLPSFQGVGEEDQAGDPLVFAGDIDADGFSDFLICAPRIDHLASDDGGVYLVTGSATGWASDRPLEEGAAQFWHGAKAGDKAGFAAAGGGDLNGDGRDDIVIGVPHADEKGSSTGQIHILLGGEL